MENTTEMTKEAAIKLLQDEAKKVEEQAMSELTKAVDAICEKYNVAITIQGGFNGNQINTGLVVKAK